MQPNKLRMILVPLPKEREQAYYAALAMLAEIIRKEIDRTMAEQKEMACVKEAGHSDETAGRAVFIEECNPEP